MKTSVRMTYAMQMELRDAARRAYGGKGKSRWVRDALEKLAEEDPALTTVGLGEHDFVPECVEQVQLSDSALELLEKLVSRVRRQDPLAEGVQSQVLRAAVRLRLERSCRPAAE